MPKEISIARLKVVLDKVKPAIMRRLEVPLTIKLDRLHMVLQAAMGWTNSHLWEFYFHDVRFGIPDPDWGSDGALDARKTTLRDVIEDTGVKSFKYMYDFGDGWQHSIKIERIEPSIPGIDYPFLINAFGDCPPEDCGGPWGYMEALQILADPKHERYKEMKEWWPDYSFSPEDLMRRVSNLAPSTTRAPRKKAS
jgi:hypothetical protein